MRKIYSIIAALILLPLLAEAQKGYPSEKAYLREATSAYEFGQFQEAYEIAYRAINNYPDNLECQDILGRSAYKVSDYVTAASYLEAVKGKVQYDEYYFYLAESMENTGEYGDAIIYYNKFNETCTDAELKASKATQVEEGIEYCTRVKDLGCNNLDYEKVYYSKASTNNADLAPLQVENTLQFTSIDSVDISGAEMSSFGQCANISLYSYVDGGVSTPMSLYNAFPQDEPGQISEYTFSLDGQRLYYSKCVCNDLGAYTCKIYYRTKKDDTWSEEKALGSSVNVDGESITTPHIAPHPVTGKEILYFTSTVKSANCNDDRAAIDTLFGGSSSTLRITDKNLFYAEVFANGACGAAVELTEFNTCGEELSPFYHKLTKTIYFSSNKHGGKGGLDIISAQWDDAAGAWTTPKPLCGGVDKTDGSVRYINTSANEMYFFINEECNKAYFTSDRIPKFSEDKDCPTPCPDIFEVDLKYNLSFCIEVYEDKRVCETKMVRIDTTRIYGGYEEEPEPDYPTNNTGYGDPEPPANDYSNPYGGGSYTMRFDTIYETICHQDTVPLNGATIKVTGTGYAPMEKTLDEYTSVYCLEEAAFDVVYKVSGSKEGYVSYTCTDDYTRIFECKDDSMVAKIYLKKEEPKINLIVNTYEKFGRAPQIGYGGGISRPEQPDYADSRAYVLFDPTIQELADVNVLVVNKKGGGTNAIAGEQVGPNEHHYVIDFNTPYEIYGQKDEYISDILTVDVAGVVTERDTTIYRDLFLFRPLPLYFDHAIPRPVTSATKLPASNTYYTYYLNYHNDYYQQEGAFVSEVAANCPDEEQTAVRDFFDNGMEEGMSRLKYFAPTFRKILAEGYTLKILIQGNASGSQRSAAYSNSNLTQRRISSMINYFAKYREQGLPEDKQLAAFINKRDFTKGALSVELDSRGASQSDTPKAGNDDCKRQFGRRPSEDRNVIINNIIITAPTGSPKSIRDLFDQEETVGSVDPEK